jgi:uncharacterized membrane protein
VAVGAALLGCATGLRSQMGLAALVNGAPGSRLPRPLRHRGARTSALVAALGELVADKLPNTPARTAPGGLASRLVLGGVTGALVGAITGTGPVVTTAIGAGTAGASAFAGLGARRWLTARMTPLTAALTEDVVAAGLAAVGVLVVSALAGDGDTGPTS